MLQNIQKNHNKILKPVVLAAMASDRVPKKITPVQLPDTLPDEGMDISDAMAMFSKNYLSSYYGEDFEKDADKSFESDLPFEETPLGIRLTENSDKDFEKDRVSIPTILGDGLGCITNNPKFSWACNPCDTEFEIEVCDALAEQFGLNDEYLHVYNGVGIINSCESDGLFTILITAQFLKRQAIKDDSSTSDKFIVYCSKREEIYPIQRIARMQDMTLRQFSSPEELQDLIAEDKSNGLHPSLVIYDAKLQEEEKFKENLEHVESLCSSEAEENEIWMHVNLGHDGCLSMLDEYKYLTKVSSDSLIIEGSKHLETSFESSLMWVKNRERIENGMHLEAKITRKFGILFKSDKYSVDYKNYQVYLGKMNRAYKVWFAVNMHGLDGLKEKIRNSIS
ncbi:unnamed protein product [Moneuplotes crassus]|uniref:Uncharacterized protein n=1 Tax=Euplotes crassus TaxID=5936 RepID=A0AAD1UUB5_EUPCR|nr:unnamed protein product [Moneuplotes crassus]